MTLHDQFLLFWILPMVPMFCWSLVTLSTMRRPTYGDLVVALLATIVPLVNAIFAVAILIGALSDVLAKPLPKRRRSQ